LLLMAILRVVPAAIFVIGEILEFRCEGSAQACFDRGKVNRPGLWLRVLMRFLDKPVGDVMRLFRLLRFGRSAARGARLKHALETVFAATDEPRQFRQRIVIAGRRRRTAQSPLELIEIDHLPLFGCGLTHGSNLNFAPASSPLNCLTNQAF
jgi:hypothetical protein